MSAIRTISFFDLRFELNDRFDLLICVVRHSALASLFLDSPGRSH